MSNAPDVVLVAGLLVTALCLARASENARERRLARAADQKAAAEQETQTPDTEDPKPQETQ